MSGYDDLTKSVVSEEERKKLIHEIDRIKEVLDSFKYGLNFEEFADEIFKTINRQTLAIAKLDEKMSDIVSRMERLETQFKQGIKVNVSSLTDDVTSISEETTIVDGESSNLESESISLEESKKDRSELEKEVEELKVKIARLFEKENEFLEMGLNDPAGAEEYEEKARVAREMRSELESKLKEIEVQLR
jgi:chromosome segregation ATPase